MADDIRLQITGDVKKAEKLVSRFEKLTKRWEKVNEKSSKRVANLDRKRARNRLKAIKRRLAAEKAASAAAVSIANKEKQQSDRLSRKRARNRLRAIRQRKRDELAAQRSRIRQERREMKERERILRRHARNRQRILRGVGRGIGGAAGLLGVGGVAGAIFKGREILRFDEALARVAVQAGVTEKKQFEMRDAINNTSLSYGAQRDVIIRAIETIVDKSGKLDLAGDNLETISKILRGTKSEAEDVGALFASISNAFKGTGKELANSDVAQFVEILVAQGDKAQINIAALASQGEKLFGAFKGAGFGTRRDFINFGALIQTAGETGTPEEASTSAVRVLSDLFQKSGKLRKKFGVNIFDKKGELKNLDVILKDLFTKTKQKTAEDVTRLSEIFGLRSIKTIKVLAAEFRNNNQEFSEFAKLIKLGDNATGNIEKKFQRVAKTSSQGFERMAAGMTLFADKALVGVMNDIATSIQSIIDNPEKLKQLENTAKELGNLLRVAANVGGAGLKVFSFLTSPLGKGGAGKRELQQLRNEKIREELAGGASLFDARREAGKIELNVKTDIKTDASGKIKSTDTTAELNNPDRGEKQVVQTGELQ